MSRKILKISLLSFILVALLSGCSFSFPWEKKRSASLNVDDNTQEQDISATAPPVFTGDLRKFANEDNLKNILAQAAPVGGLTSSWLLAESGYGVADDKAALKVPGGLNTGFIGADIVKIDSGHAYVLIRNEIKIISLAPASEAKIVGQISLDSRPGEFFVAGGRLVVFGTDEKIKDSSLFRSFKRQGKYTFLQIFDVSFPGDPKEIRSLSFEGGYVGARLSGNYVYLLTANPASYSDNESLVPRVVDNGRVISGNCVLGKDCFRPDIFYFDTDYRNHTFLSVTAVNIADRNEPLGGQAFLVDANFNIYLSLTGSLYLTRTESLSLFSLEQEIRREKVYPRLSEAEQVRIKEIENAPAFVLSQQEKVFKTSTIIDRYVNSLDTSGQDNLRLEVESALLPKIKQRVKELDKTDIYKFALRAGKIDYQAKGSVSGNVLSSGSIDEKGDGLRLITTRSLLWSRLSEDSEKIYSNIYILDSGLRPTGSLENIVTESGFHAVSFMGDRAYISAINENAPIYVVSLADSTKPAVLGAVRVNGYSHIYPLDSKGEKIISLGRDVEVGKATGPLKLSLFDFSDLQKPKELSSYLIGDNNSASIALSDYKALSYLPTYNTIVLPAALRESDQLVFAGALVFESDEGALALKSRLDHSAGGKFSQVDSWRGFNYYDNTVKRSWLIGDNLFTFSNKYLKIHRLADFSEIKTLILTPGDENVNINRVPENLATDQDGADEQLEQDSVDMTNSENALKADSDSSQENQPSETVKESSADSFNNGAVNPPNNIPEDPSKDEVNE